MIIDKEKTTDQATTSNAIVIISKFIGQSPNQFLLYVCSLAGMAQHPDQRNVEELPCDIFFNILSRLHIVDLLNCKYVSSQWRSSVQEPDFASTHISRPPDAADNLSLVVQSKYRFSTSNPLHMIPIEDRTQTTKRINVPYQWLMHKLRMVGSCNGFLCLYDTSSDGGPVFLYNPYTRESHQLPEIGFKTHLIDSPTVVFGFGFDPTTNDYKVIKVIYDRVLHFSMGKTPVNSQVWILTIGNRNWRRIDSTSYRLYGLCSEVLVDGKLHWLAQSYNSDEVQIVSFNLHKEAFQTVAHPLNLSPLGCSYYHHLVKSRGCLSIVATRPDKTTEVWTMKNYNVQESWTKEFVIDKHVPEGIELHCNPAIWSMKNSSSRKYVQVICPLQTGETLLLYSSRKLVAFHPQRRTFRPVEFDGLPHKFHIMVHGGSLASMNSAAAINK